MEVPAPSPKNPKRFERSEAVERLQRAVVVTGVFVLRARVRGALLRIVKRNVFVLRVRRA